MNTVPGHQEKRSIRVKDFLQDFQSGATDLDLLRKYNLTPVGLDKFLGMLTERGILDQKQIQARYAPPPVPGKEAQPIDLEESSFICPSCLTSHETMFDICTTCGASFQDTLRAQSSREEPVRDAATPEASAGKHGFDWEKDFPEIFAAGLDSPAKDIPPAPAKEILGAQTSPEELDSFRPLGDPRGMPAPFDDADDEVVSGEPIASRYAEDDEGEDEMLPHCDSCHEKLDPALRDVYDPKRSRRALETAGALLGLGFVGFVLLSLLGSFSLVRVIALYITGVSVLFGAILGAVGTFLYLAREKVYYCSSCHRVYPRG